MKERPQSLLAYVARLFELNDEWSAEEIKAPLPPERRGQIYDCLSQLIRDGMIVRLGAGRYQAARR